MCCDYHDNVSIRDAFVVSTDAHYDMIHIAYIVKHDVIFFDKCTDLKLSNIFSEISWSRRKIFKGAKIFQDFSLLLGNKE